VKFAHISDVHIGGWRDPRLREINLESFRRAVDKCVEENVAFLLISGDLFNTALPPIELIREVASKLDELRQNDIEVYIIPGSHDFSPSGKTMLDVLERAGLVQNVFKFNDGALEFTHDKTGAKITGLLGRRGGLEKSDYELLKKGPLEKEEGFKIFMFHSLLNELKPVDLDMVEGSSLKDLPKGFHYYAGGHPHFVFSKEFKDYGLVTYPGALYPNNFKELEKFKHGGLYILDYSNGKLTHRWEPVVIKDVVSFCIDANSKRPDEVEKEAFDKFGVDVKGKIVTIRVEGMLREGKPSDINFREIFSRLYDNGAHCVLRNINKLTSKEFEELMVEAGNVDDVENKIIEEHLGQINIDLDEKKLTNELMNVFNTEKQGGETNLDFEDKLVKNIVKVFGIKETWDENLG